MSATEVRAVSKYVRISPQKVRRIVQGIKGMPVEAGLDTLKFMPQKAAGIVEKVVRSAAANADQKPDVDVDTLVIQNIIADQGPTLKRFRPRAQGRAYRINKKTSHIVLVVAER